MKTPRKSGKPKKIFSEQELLNRTYGAIRRVHRLSPNYQSTLDEGRRETTVKCKNGNDAYRVFYSCQQCKDEFPKKNIHVDHIDPVVPIGKSIDLNTYYQRVHCIKSNLQRLCKKCHKAKTGLENKERRRIKLANKPKT